MKLFTAFFLYILIGLGVYFVLALFRKRSAIPSRLFFYIAPAVALLQNLIALGLAGSAGRPGWLHPVSLTLQWLGFASLLLLGYGLGYALEPRKSQPAAQAGAPTRARATIWLIRGLSLQLGISFIASGIEQYLDLEGIRKWFIDSGYTGSFTYVIILIQILAGALLLLNLRFYPKLATIIVLLAVMIGAILTHIHRGDKFPIMIAATILAVKCLILLWLCPTERGRQTLPSITSLH